MKRTLLILLVFSCANLVAQEIQENFDSYAAGDLAGVVSPVIDTWSGGTADDQMLVDSVFHSAPNSLSLFSDAANGGPGDIIVPLDYSDMGYMVSFYIYVEEGNGAYYNIQTDITPGLGWAYDLFFDANGTIDYQIGQVSQGTGTYTNAAWVLIENDIDLVNNIAKISIDGEEQMELPFESNLGSINFYPTSNEAIAHYYIDDIEVNQYQPVSVSELEIQASIYPNPASDVVNVSGVSNNSNIIVQDLLGKQIFSTTTSGSVTSIQTSEWETGYYFLTISNENGKVTRKVIVE